MDVLSRQAFTVGKHFLKVSKLKKSKSKFMRSVFSGRLDCPDLVAMFSLSAPSRRSRRPELFHVPRGRVDSVRRGFLVRLPQLVNSLTHSYPQTDLFLPSDNLVSVITMFARERGTYLSWARCHSSLVLTLPEHTHHCSCTSKSAVISVISIMYISLPSLLMAFLPLVYF